MVINPRWAVDAENVRGELLGSWRFWTKRSARRFAAAMSSPLYSLILHRAGDELAERETLSVAMSVDDWADAVLDRLGSELGVDELR